MPAAADASKHHESDSEDDLDYIPEGGERDLDTEEERGTKRPRVESPPLAPENSAAAKIERQALWAKFQDSVSAPLSVPPESEPKRMVKIEKRHRFAGEEVVEIVEIPEDSADAKKWPLWKPTDGQDEATTPNIGDSGVPKPSTGDLPPAKPTPPPPPAAATTSQQPSTTTTKPRPGRRKPKVQLADVPSAADSRKGLKRLTTLEKSALDWKAHVDPSAGESKLVSELEANRRGGGYLEKVEFLQRVEDRKNQTLDANKDHKRRRE